MPMTDATAESLIRELQGKVDTLTQKVSDLETRINDQRELANTRYSESMTDLIDRLEKCEDMLPLAHHRRIADAVATQEVTQ